MEQTSQGQLTIGEQDSISQHLSTSLYEDGSTARNAADIVYRLQQKSPSSGNLH